MHDNYDQSFNNMNPATPRGFTGICFPETRLGCHVKTLIGSLFVDSLVSRTCPDPEDVILEIYRKIYVLAPLSLRVQHQLDMNILIRSSN